MRKILFAVLLLSLACAVANAVSSPASGSSLERGVVLYQKESYDEAIVLLQQARQEDPRSARAAYYLGMAYKRVENYRDAKKQLLEAVSGTPKVKEALLELIEVLYQLGQLDEAKDWIYVAEKEGIRPAQIAFLKGMVLAKAGDNGGALKAFEDSKSLDEKLKQGADYQIALIHLKEKRLSEAQKAFQEVLGFDPNTDLADIAGDYMQAIGRQKEAQKFFRGNIGFFTEFDTNVVLEPSDLTVVQEISEEKDWREVVTAAAEVQKKFSDEFGLKANYSFYLANQEELTDFNVNSHTWGLVPSYQKGKALLSGPVQYNYTWVHGEGFLSTVYATPSMNLQMPNSQLAQLSCKLQGMDFLNPPVNSDEDRDGFRVAPAIGWFFFYAENKGYVNLRYEMDVVDASGTNWSYFGNRVTGAIVFPFLEKWKIAHVQDLFVQAFDNTHTVFNEARNDVIYTISTVLGYTVFKGLEAQLRYTFVNDNSNIPLFRYERSVFSMGLTYAF